MKPRTKKIIIWLSVVFVIALIIGGFFISKSNKPTVEYSSYMAQKTDLAQTVSATGSAKAKAAYDLNFQTAGKVQSILVEEGDYVE